MSLETTPVVIGVEGPSSTVGGLQAPSSCTEMHKKMQNRKVMRSWGMGDLRILASFLINIVSVANWLPIVPVENGTGQSATPLAERDI